MQQQVTIWPVDVEWLGAVFAAAGSLSSPEVLQSMISRRRLSWTGSCRLGVDARREFNCVWDDGVAALQRVPEGGVGGFGGWRSTAVQRGGGASMGQVWQRDASTRDFGSLSQVWWFGGTNWLESSQLGATSSWKRERTEEKLRKRMISS